MSTERQKETARKNGKLGGGSARLIDLTGKVFGNWTVLHRKGRSTKDRHITWWCRCICGTEREVHGGNLMHGGSLGCGCTKERRRLRPYEALYRTIQRENEDKLVELTYEEFLDFTKIKQCHYCEAPVEWTEFHLVRNGSRYNLDRKDNSIGYSKENCVVCCKRCNRIKSDHLTYEQMLQIGALIRTWPT